MTADTEPTYPLTILVELEEGTGHSRVDLQEMVDDLLVEDANGRPWTVRRFFDCDAVGPRTRNFYEINGQVPVSPSYPIRSLGFQLSAVVAERLVGPLAGTAMPDFPSTVFGPAELVNDREPGPATKLATGRAADGLAWPLLAMRCEAAWRLDPPRPEGRKRGAGIVIGHPDSGFTFHQELLASLDLERDYDVVDHDTSAEDPMKKRWWWPFDSPGHGTSTGSAIVSTEWSLITGVAPEATLLPLRAVRNVVQVSDGDVARAIDRATGAGAHVISMSLGGIGFYSAIRDALVRARAAGVLVLAAAGNKVKFVVAPARFDECIAVAATDRANQPWDGSSRGDDVLVSAPGHQVPIAKATAGSSPSAPGTDSDVSSGTSYAVAHVAGVAALWLAFHDRDHLLDRYGPFGLQEAFEEVVTTVGFERPVPWDDAWGVGLIDAVKVLEAPLPTPAARRLAVAVEADRADGADAADERPTAPSPTERLIELGVAPGRDSRSALCDILRCSDDELDELARIHGPELAYAFTENSLATELDEAPVVGPTLRAARQSGLTGRDLAGMAALSPKLRARLQP